MVKNPESLKVKVESGYLNASGLILGSATNITAPGASRQIIRCKDCVRDVNSRPDLADREHEVPRRTLCELCNKKIVSTYYLRKEGGNALAFVSEVAYQEYETEVAPAAQAIVNISRDVFIVFEAAKVLLNMKFGGVV